MIEVKFVLINIELLLVEILWWVGYENVDYFVKLFMWYVGCFFNDYCK